MYVCGGTAAVAQAWGINAAELGCSCLVVNSTTLAIPT